MSLLLIVLIVLVILAFGGFRYSWRMTHHRQRSDNRSQV
jgi:Flp pilus assembly protein TadB